MKKLLVGLLSWRRLIIMTVGLPLVVSAAVMAFAWPASRIAPRDLPVGIVGTSTASQNAVAGLARSAPGGFDFHLYADEASARSAIKNREVYGAFVITPGNLTVLEATAASTTVAQLLNTAGQELAAHAPQPAPKSTPLSSHGASAPHGASAEAGAKKGAPKKDTVNKGAAKKDAAKNDAAKKDAVQTPAKVRVTTVDVVPSSADDPRGVVFSSAILPLTICGVIIALGAMSVVHTSAWRRPITLVTVSAAAGFGVFLVAQGVLGALPHEHVATWAALSLTLFAVSATSAGLMTLTGPAGLGLSATLMVFIGNPFSGSTSAPELLPKAVDDIGQWLPPGAGANLVRGVAYFDGNDSGGHITVLVLWSVLGLAAVIFGHRGAVVTDDSLVEAPHRVDGEEQERATSSETAPAVRPTPEGYFQPQSAAPAENRPHAHARHAAGH
ncbi:ABC transporter permease [Streptomyces sp. NPDC059582]|uniref:ABC transporter permease n=1 Tax=Streptomyces sp. NPDC059582 TaxID=3346875 RepID=UPI00367E934C